MAPLRRWHRLSVRLAILFASVTLVAVALVGLLVYEWQRREVEEAVGSPLLNIVRTAKIVGVESDDGIHLAPVHPTSVGEADRGAIESLITPSLGALPCESRTT